MDKNLVSLVALHTHTHTHTHTGVSSEQQWSKGGSREQRNLAILPRDLK